MTRWLYMKWMGLRAGYAKVRRGDIAVGCFIPLEEVESISGDSLVLMGIGPVLEDPRKLSFDIDISETIIEATPSLESSPLHLPLATNAEIYSLANTLRSNPMHPVPISDSVWQLILDRCSVSTLLEMDAFLDPGVALRMLSRAEWSGSDQQLASAMLHDRHDEEISERTFARLVVEEWRQFKRVELDLDARLTVITGANGAGKTSILNLLSSHFDWQTLFVGVPRYSQSGQLRYWTGATSRAMNGGGRIGVLEYNDGKVAEIFIQESPQINFSPEWSDRQLVNGIYIPSHRMQFTYSTVSSIPSAFSASRTILEGYLSEMRTRQAGGWSGKTTAHWLKESLLAAALHGAGPTSAQEGGWPGNQEASNVWLGFQLVLQRLLPESLHFRRLVARPPEVLIQTSTGEFALDSASGGVAALIEMAWQIFLRSREAPAFTVCFDEPENHLHPELQRTILPRLLGAFPGVSFVIATHSPFLVTSVPDANVAVLDFDAAGLVVSRQLDFREINSSAEEVLRRVLGVSSTLPSWVNSSIDEIVRRYSTLPLSEESLGQLRHDLNELGLDDEFPATLAAIARSRRNL